MPASTVDCCDYGNLKHTELWNEWPRTQCKPQDNKNLYKLTV